MRAKGGTPNVVSCFVELGVEHSTRIAALIWENCRKCLSDGSQLGSEPIAGVRNGPQFGSAGIAGVRNHGRGGSEGVAWVRKGTRGCSEGVAGVRGGGRGGSEGIAGVRRGGRAELRGGVQPRNAGRGGVTVFVKSRGGFLLPVSRAMCEDAEQVAQFGFHGCEVAFGAEGAEDFLA